VIGGPSSSTVSSRTRSAATHRDDGGGARYHVYTWWHDADVIYVGKGVGSRSLKFLTSQAYNSDEAHAYIRANWNALTRVVAVSAVPQPAAFAIEHALISYFKRRCDNGTLFNRSPGHRPPPGTGNDVSHLRRPAEIVTASSIPEPLTTAGHIHAWKHVTAARGVPLSAAITGLPDQNPWSSGAPDARVLPLLKRHDPATLADAVKLLADNGHKSGEQGAYSCLIWLWTWNKGFTLNGLFYTPENAAALAENAAALGA
jgi:hypothetical protein